MTIDRQQEEMEDRRSSVILPGGGSQSPSERMGTNRDDEAARKKNQAGVRNRRSQIDEVGSAGEERMNSLLVVGRKLSLARPMRWRVVLPLLSACLLALGAPGARGQVTNVDDTTSTPIEGAGHNYVKLLSETVNPVPAKPEWQHPEASALKSTRTSASGDLDRP